MLFIGIIMKGKGSNAIKQINRFISKFKAFLVMGLIFDVCLLHLQDI